MASRVHVRPDIVWIVTTQWRAQACGYAGDPNARTPHLDALAAQSVNYAQAVTPHPFGPFARAALLTGVPSPENGVRDYFDPLPLASRTIAHALRERGYVTGFFGQWHLGRRDPKAPLVGPAHAKTLVPPEARGGFQTWDGFESGFLLNDPWLHGWTSEAPEQHFGYQSDVVCERAARWLEERRHGGESPPVFCVVSLSAPHPPYGAPAAEITPPAKEGLALSPTVPRGDAETKAREELPGYYAHIEATDRALGRFLARRSIAHAIVVFTSVHGDMHGAHGLFRKGWPYEESVRVPLLVRGAPGELRAGAVSRSPVSLIDLASWTLAWAEGHVPAVVPPLEPQRISMPSVVALPHQCDRPWRGWRTPRRKLVLDDEGSPWLYFDLERDPGERCNLANEPSQAAEILAWREALDRRENRARPLA